LSAWFSLVEALSNAALRLPTIETWRGTVQHGMRRILVTQPSQRTMRTREA